MVGVGQQWEQEADSAFSAPGLGPAQAPGDKEKPRGRTAGPNPGIPQLTATHLYQPRVGWGDLGGMQQPPQRQDCSNHGPEELRTTGGEAHPVAD